MSDDLADRYATLRTEIPNDARAGTNAAFRARAYITLMLLIPLAFLASAIPIVRSSSFPLESEDPFLLDPDYAFALKHVDCDVVIVGDSTALTGLDPPVVASATGLKTCNIAQSQSIVKLLGTLALDTYLTNNLPPRFIVMQFAPESLASDRMDFFWPEGLTLLIRKKNLLEAVPVLAAHPVQTYNFALWAIKAKIRALDHTPTDFGPTQAIFRARNGLLILPKPPETHCVNHIPYVRPKTSWVRALKGKYERNGTRVLINVSPLPDCTPDADVIARYSRGVTDNPLALYPIGLFCDLDRHLTLEGADRASIELGHQLTLQMKQNQ